MKLLLTITLLAIATGSAFAGNPRVEMQTNAGSIIVELFPDKAPKTVENFLRYAKSGFYEGTVFHRAIKNFMVQGGAFDQAFDWRQPSDPIPNEAKNGLTNEPGTIAMARERDPNSATSQFFVNLESNKHLNHYRDDPNYYGHCVFGKIVRGMDIMRQIAERPTGAGGPFASDVPLEPVIIEKVVFLEQETVESQTPKSKPKRKGKPHGKTKDQSRRHLAGT